LKPLDFYHKKYGTAFYGVQKMQLLLQKMRNRGQDGAGIATIKLNPNREPDISAANAPMRPITSTDLFDMVWARLNAAPPNSAQRYQMAP
jgi:amidophosphoribosyltransferase